MPLQKILIAPLKEGMITQFEPWTIPNDAFVYLNNVYCFRNRIKKRPSTLLFNDTVDLAVRHLHSRLRVKMPGTTAAGTGNYAGNAPGNKFKIGQLFSVEGITNASVFTVWQNGATLNNFTSTATFNTGTGAFAITGNGENPGADVFYYPAEPVMGIITYENSSINDEKYFAFDTQFSYEYTGSAWERFGAPTTWQGNDTNFFWGTNWRGVANNNYYLFVVNYNQPDQIKYWDGTNWQTINPQITSGGATLESSRIILAFKNRLICLNTIESTGTYTNRCRFSVNGDPTAVNAWRQDIVGQGGYVDASTREAIVTAEFLKDRLIVYFERSTWELVYTGNNVLPFIWQKINTELGCESTFSVIPFDKVVLGVGNVGIHACNGSNVQRIDEKIEDVVFRIHNNNSGPLRVAGIRDYKTDLVYWAIPDEVDTRVFPNNCLIYHYPQQAWSFMTESITAFGYFQTSVSRTWAGSVGITWETANFPWNSGTLQAKFLDVIAGNQQGFMFYVEPEMSYNDRTRQITNITNIMDTTADITCINHNFSEGDYVQIKEAGGVTGMNDVIGVVDTVTDVDTFVFASPTATFAGTYTGNGTLIPVSNIQILSKQYNFFTDKGYNTAIQRMEFLVNKTENGEIQTNYGPSFTYPLLPTAQAFPDSILGTSILSTAAYDVNFSPLEQIQNKLWHVVYTNLSGSTFQFELTFNEEQITNELIAAADFDLEAIVLYVSPSSARLE